MAGIAGPYSAAQPAISAGGAGRNCPLADRSAEHVARPTGGYGHVGSGWRVPGGGKAPQHMLLDRPRPAIGGGQPAAPGPADVRGAFGQSGTASIVSSITSTFRLCLN
jgi:hypothetical protein